MHCDALYSGHGRGNVSANLTRSFPALPLPEPPLPVNIEVWACSRWQLGSTLVTLVKSSELGHPSSHSTHCHFLSEIITTQQRTSNGDKKYEFAITTHSLAARIVVKSDCTILSLIVRVPNFCDSLIHRILGTHLASRNHFLRRTISLWPNTSKSVKQQKTNALLFKNFGKTLFTLFCNRYLIFNVESELIK